MGGWFQSTEADLSDFPQRHPPTLTQGTAQLQFDTTINMPTLVTLAIAIVGFIVYLVRLEGKVGANRVSLDELIKERGALEALVNLTREQLHDYQLQVAREYVTHVAVGEIKRDIITEIGRMEQRVENQINRLVETRS